MSYRDEKQSLESVSDILSGIEKFNAAVNERIKSDDWKQDHLTEIHELRMKLIAIQIELENVRKENW